MTTILEVEQLTHHYGSTVALDQVTFQVFEGEIFGLLGPNGAGKTTLLSIVSGLLTARAGEVRIQGDRFQGEKDLRRVIGIVPQETALYSELTARENLELFGELYGLSDGEISPRIETILKAIGLTDRADRRAGTFSGGMKRRLNLGMALIHNPRLLLLDEPTVGVDPQSRNHIFEEVRRLNAEGVTIVYTSHYMEEVQSLCSRIGIIDHGKLIACDTLSSLLGMLDGIIELQVESPSPGLMAQLAALPGTKVSSSGQGVIRLECRDVKGALLRLATLLKDLHIEMTAMELQEPNLERVFLHLTGKALRD